MRLFEVIPDTGDVRRWVHRTRQRLEHDEFPRPGHEYRNVLTDETITIESVGPQVLVSRHDAELNHRASPSKQDVQIALDTGLLVHDRHRCSSCPNQRRAE